MENYQFTKAKCRPLPAGGKTGFETKTFLNLQGEAGSCGASITFPYQIH